jgi:hypothetical protein
MMTQQGFLILALIAVGAIVLFLLLREIALWYWRVNEAIAVLKSIDQKLGTYREPKPPLGVLPKALADARPRSMRAGS